MMALQKDGGSLESFLEFMVTLIERLRWRRVLLFLNRDSGRVYAKTWNAWNRASSEEPSALCCDSSSIFLDNPSRREDIPGIRSSSYERKSWTRTRRIDFFPVCRLWIEFLYCPFQQSDREQSEQGTFCSQLCPNGIGWKTLPGRTIEV